MKKVKNICYFKCSDITCVDSYIYITSREYSNSLNYCNYINNTYDSKYKLSKDISFNVFDGLYYVKEVYYA